VEFPGILDPDISYSLGMKRVALCYRKEESTKPYADALRSVALEPVLISPSLAAVDRRLLSGGAGLNPPLGIRIVSGIPLLSSFFCPAFPWTAFLFCLDMAVSRSQKSTTPPRYALDRNSWKRT
jgi:hypothetical protein